MSLRFEPFEPLRSLVTTTAAVALLATSSAAAAAPPLDSRAMEVLRSMSATLAGAETLSVTSVALYESVQPGGIALSVGQRADVQVRRPDRLHARVRRDDGAHRQIWFDGKTATVYDPAANTYSNVDAPGTLDDMFHTLNDDHGVDLPLSDLLFADPAAEFERYLISAAYIGLRTVEGVRAHHLSFESRGADFQLWVSADGPALPLRFAITYVNEPGEPALVAAMRDWELSPYIGEGTFTFHRPAGATEVPLRPTAQ